MLKKCSFDGKRSSAGVATSYWRWFVAEDTAVGYRIYSCFDCSNMLFTQLGSAVTAEPSTLEPTTCVKCGGEWDDSDPAVFVFFYPPKAERIDIQAPLCPECLDAFVEPIRLNGTILIDRDPSARVREASPWGFLYQLPGSNN